MRKLIAASLALALPLGGCRSTAVRSTKDGALKDTWGMISTKRHIKVRGIGAAPAGIENETQRRALSRQAALAAGRLEMLAYLKGVEIKANLTVEQAMATDSEIRTFANRLVSAAEEVGCEWLDDGGAVVTLQIERSAVKKLLERDKPYEPVPPSTEAGLSGSRLDNWSRPRTTPRARRRRTAPSRVTAGTGRGASPDAALLAGLLFPGLGHAFAQDDWMTEADRNRIAARGLCFMAGTLSLTGLGVAALLEKPKETGDMDSGGRKKTNEKELRGVGYGLLALAGIVHLLGARDAYKSATTVALVPGRNSVGFALTRRFGGRRSGRGGGQ